MVKLGMFISDRYEIIEKVGTGGMADVYKAKCHRLNRFVAIKVLKQEYSTDTKFVSKFRAEAQSVAGLSHPNIVSVYDVGEDEGLYYIVMELVEGITLKSYIERKGKLEVNEALGIAIQIAQGMDVAHKHKIIHRDIKPQNIIISKEGKVKVTDFGIAKAASSNTITSNAMGSVHYISPEQARGGYSDEKSDIYSLGVTLYEMLNGNVPFSGENTVAVALAHIQEEMVPLSVLEPKIPSSVDKIVQKCMKKKTEQRYLNASALIADLKRAIEDPDGDFVNLSPMIDNNSPTIHIPTEEINGAAKGIKESNGNQNGVSSGEKEEAEQGKESEIDPKLEKALVIGSIAVAVIICAIIIAIIGNIAGFWGKSNKNDPTPSPDATPSTTDAPATASPDGNVTAEMPDLVDLTQEEAEMKLEALSLDVDCDVVPEENEMYEEGKVIRTDPEAYANIKDGDTVTLYVSSGKKKVTVPNLYEYDPEDAQTKLLDLKLKVTHASQHHEKVPEGKVIGTNPKSGTEVREEDTVTIIVSEGPEKVYVKVPSLLGLSKAEAKKALEKKGLKVGTIDNKYSNDYKSGTVCAQSVKKNQQVEKGTAIDYTVSLGPKQTPTPEPKFVYKGTVRVTANPFSSEEEEFANFRFILEQDGKSKEIKYIKLGYHSFPYEFDDFEGFAEGSAKVKILKDEVLISTIEINLSKVPQ